MLTRPLLEELEESDEDVTSTPSSFSSSQYHSLKRPRVPSSSNAVQVTLSSSIDLDTISGIAVAASNQQDYIWQQRRVILDVWIPLLIFILLCFTIAGCGVCLAFFSSIIPKQINDLLRSYLNSEEITYLGYTILSFSIILPIIFLILSTWCAIPGIRQRQRSELLSDTTLEEIALSSRSALRQHVTIFSPIDQKPVGLIILLSGCGCPRETTFVLARELSSSKNGYPVRAVCIDLPGNGTLSRVKYSYARCERLLKFLISIELEELKRIARDVKLTSSIVTATSSSYFKVAALTSVILYCYSGSINFGIQFATSNKQLVSGIASAGRIESFSDRTLRNFLLESLLRLRSACAVADVSVKGRVMASRGEDKDKGLILTKTFELSVLPEMIRETRLRGGGGFGLFECLKDINRNVLFFGTENAILVLKRRVGVIDDIGEGGTGRIEKGAQDSIQDKKQDEGENVKDILETDVKTLVKVTSGTSGQTGSTILVEPFTINGKIDATHKPKTFIVARGVRDEFLPSLDKNKNAFLATEILKFAVSSFSSFAIELEQLSELRKRDEEIFKAKKASNEAVSDLRSSSNINGRAYSTLSGSSRQSSRQSSLPSRMSSPISDQLRSSISGNSTSTPTLSSSLTRDVSGILRGSMTRDIRDDYGSFGEGGGGGGGGGGGRTGGRKSSASVRFAD
jgi:hypothetical protein